MDIFEKLTILASAAKYDVSCASSGSRRENVGNQLGNAAPSGICHTYTEDGRCVSLLKILYTNFCIYDCLYCINRVSNDIPRAAFSPNELVDLTINFYRRNYIEGLFLSSGVMKSPDDTMERLIKVIRDLRKNHGFNGYIHLKAFPGTSDRLIQEAGRYADRLSVNIEIPSESNLQLLAPDKSYSTIYKPMEVIREGISENIDERRKFRSAPKFTPAGQSTQLIVGASPESDYEILGLAKDLYGDQRLKRVYYSAYVPVNPEDSCLPAVTEPPLVRENRLYQADWLLRLYGFDLEDILSPAYPDLDLKIDPKLAYALRNPELFPVDVNRADYELLLRIPGIGLQSARRIVRTRAHGSIRYEHLKKIGVVLKRARYFITCPGQPASAGPTLVENFDRHEELRQSSEQRVMLSFSTKTTFFYDCTFEGLLTAVYETFSRKILPDDIRGDKSVKQMNLFERGIEIETSIEKAERVWRKLRQTLGDKPSRSLYRAFLSDAENIEMSIYSHIKAAVGQRLQGADQLESVLQIEKMSRKVGREAHRMRGFVRFKKLKDGLYLALIAPQYDVLSLIRRHFERRYADQRWMIYDCCRHYGLYYDTKQTVEIRLQAESTEIDEVLHNDERDYQRLWKQYFQHINVPERRNSKLHLQKLPRRYWEYLTEKQ